MSIKNFRLCLLLLLTSFTRLSFGQLISPDEVKTNQGTLVIQPINHGSLVLKWNEKIIYIDPYGGLQMFKSIPAPDIILITDIHGDHMVLKTLEAIGAGKADIVGPRAVAEQLPEIYKSKISIIGNGEKINKLGIEITAIPMYNLPETPDSRHPKGRGNGYILNIGGKNIYISGDTEDIPEMRQLKDIDIAFICMNGPTMDIDQAASAVLEFKPKIVYPFHYRGSDTEAFRKLVNNGSKDIEVRLKNWYP